MDLINRYGIILRLVDEADAEFILKLRTNTALNKFISFTSPDIKAQIKWMQEYKTRGKAELEYYYVVQDLVGNKYGTIRLYNFDEKSFEIGSLLFDLRSPLGMAIKAHFIGFEIGFEELNAEYCRFEVRKKNIAVLRYFQNFVLTLVNEDDLNFYFTLSRDDFYILRNKFSIFSTYKINPKINP